MCGKKRTGFSIRNLYFYIGYWIIYLIFFSVQRVFAVKSILEEIGIKRELDELKVSFFTNLIYLPLAISVSHFVINFLFPRYFYSKRFSLFALFTGLTIILYPALAFVVRMLFIDPVFPPPQKYSFDNYYAAMLIFVFGMAPLAWYEIAKHLGVEEQIKQKIDKDRLEALLKLKETELKLLKSQIQPHFLFNTLNNLYSLAIEKSDKAPELIIRLSDMLSYIIYDCKSEKVPLSKEIEFIKNYIELQKVRFETCDIDFSFNHDVNEKMIAPMILHTFIDNCFKHGAEKDPGSPWIQISIKSFNGSMSLSVINSIHSDGSGIGNNAGIGIKNTMKRLELLYRDRHELVMHNSGKKFSVFLKMQL